MGERAIDEHTIEPFLAQEGFLRLRIIILIRRRRKTIIIIIIMILLLL